MVSGVNTAQIGFQDPAAMREFAHSNKISEEQKIAEGAKQFEGIFLRYVLKDALKPMFKTGFINKDDSSNDIYRHMMIDSLANSMSQQGVFGLSNMVEAQLSANSLDEKGRKT